MWLAQLQPPQYCLYWTQTVLQSYGYILNNYLPDRKACCDFVGTLGSSFSVTPVHCPAACFRCALPPIVTPGRLGKDVIASEPHFCKKWSSSHHWVCNVFEEYRKEDKQSWSNVYVMWHVRSAQQCCWRFKSFGMWCWVTAWRVPDVLKDHNTFIFKVR